MRMYRDNNAGKITLIIEAMNKNEQLLLEELNQGYGDIDITLCTISSYVYPYFIVERDAL